MQLLSFPAQNERYYPIRVAAIIAATLGMKRSPWKALVASAEHAIINTQGPRREGLA